MSRKQQMKQLYVLFNKCINKWGTKDTWKKFLVLIVTYDQNPHLSPYK